MSQPKKGTWAVDYGKVNLKSLIITNDPELYEKQKAKGEVAVLFEPSVLEEMKAGQGVVYLVGVNEMNQLTEDRVREIVREEMEKEATAVTIAPVFSADVCRDEIAKQLEEAISKATARTNAIS
ncbi:hypothetical protein [Paenibacillus bouchesdurhonensis]|uniref:hypothetical protein n=1 Tax=Paenibacillus bouchesdurhonensis TaxID=1870990 RepID=UPI000DA62D4E|nr:hypothetical protein [Paenibacillus bouchesdurhonensis]